MTACGRYSGSTFSSTLAWSTVDVAGTPALITRVGSSLPQAILDKREERVGQVHAPAEGLRVAEPQYDAVARRGSGLVIAPSGVVDADLHVPLRRDVSSGDARAQQQ